MKNLFNPVDTPDNKISYWLLAAFCVALPFDFFYSEIILILFSLHTCIHCRPAYFKMLATRELLLLISIYLLAVSGLAYSPDKAEGLNIVTRQIAILLIPVMFSLNQLDLEKYRFNLFAFFAFSCTVAIIYLFADALHAIIRFHLPFSSLFSLAFMNHNFSLPIGIHATYLSLYVAFSIVIFACLLFTEKEKGKKYLYAACMIILSLGLLQLSSRSVFIALLLVINIAFPVFLFRGRKRMLFSAAALIFSMVLLLVITHIDSFKERYINELKKDLADKAALIEMEEPRMARWEAIMELVKRSPLIGFGTGAEKEMLKEKYYEKKMFSSYINEFNTHSQYLGFLLRGGLVALSLFLYLLFTGFGKAWKKRDPIFTGFLILITVVCVAENMLDLNKGIFFYSFFFSLFLLKDRQNSINKAIFKPVTGNPV